MDKTLPTPQTYCDVSKFFTPLPEAVAEIERRRKDPELRRKVEAYLHGDIPEHFTYSKPIFYLSRHIATPNYETLRFIELTEHYELPRVIGVDPFDKFTSNNVLKRSLGKMPVTKGVSRNGDEIIENFTVVDFLKYDGEMLRDVKTTFGEPLLDFHTNLFREIYPTKGMIINEAKWVDNHHRGALVPEYIDVLSLLITHGIMFEFYEPEDREFVQQVLEPTFNFVTSIYGVKPLIVNLVDAEIANTRNWNGYPSVIYQHIKQKLAQQ
jgi:hypothetical protein